MSPLTRSTPARLTVSATAKLPRLVLLGLSLVYIVAGLIMRDPWKTDDAVGVATMVTALREGG
ncbi:membrane protein [Bordetella trematum]|nr:membrane protein [Bordetella trematum]